MKISLRSLTIPSCLLVVFLISCESHEQTPDDAFENIKELKEKEGITPEIIQEVEKIEVAKPDEWTQFKTETENKIVANEAKIKKIKSIPNASTKLLKQVTDLEKDNNDLRRQMDEYKEEMKVMWESFKIKINHDVNEIDIELKDLIINNKQK
jgi:hypothetical protein